MMSDLYWLTDEPMARLRPYFPKSHGLERVDDRRVLSGIIFVNRNGRMGRDAPREYGAATTLYNHRQPGRDKVINNRLMECFPPPTPTTHTNTMINAPYM